MASQKLEPRYVRPASAYTRSEHQESLDIKIYQMFNPDHFHIEPIIPDVFHNFSSYLAFLPEEKCYDKAGFAVISTFAAEQKKSSEGWITLGMWNKITPRQTAFEVNNNKIKEMPKSEANWCLYEILGIVQFEAKEWAKYLNSEKTALDLDNYLNSYPPEGLLKI